MRTGAFRPRNRRAMFRRPVARGATPSAAARSGDRHLSHRRRAVRQRRRARRSHRRARRRGDARNRQRSARPLIRTVPIVLFSFTARGWSSRNNASQRTTCRPHDRDNDAVVHTHRHETLLAVVAPACPPAPKAGLRRWGRRPRSQTRAPQTSLRSYPRPFEPIQAHLRRRLHRSRLQSPRWRVLAPC